MLAADTLSIATMEVVDNAVMALAPGAMHAGLANPVFRAAMALALTVAFAAAHPVNHALMRRGRGHALVHDQHGGDAPVSGWRRFVPVLATPVLLTGVAMVLLGGFVASAVG